MLGKEIITVCTEKSYRTHKHKTEKVTAKAAGTYSYYSALKV
jgi:hypothetical protein